MKNFILNCLSDSSVVSFGRAASALCLFFCLGWDTAYITFAMRHVDFIHISLPDVLPPAGVLLAQSTFCASFYGINKLKASVDAHTSPGTQPQD